MTIKTITRKVDITTLNLQVNSMQKQLARNEKTLQFHFLTCSGWCCVVCVINNKSARRI